MSRTATRLACSSWNLSKPKSHQLSQSISRFQAMTPARNLASMVESPNITQTSLRLQTLTARRVRRDSMLAASSPGKWMMSRQRASFRRTLRTLVGIFSVNFSTSSLMSSSWCLMRPCQRLSSFVMSTPPKVPSAACRAFTVSSRALLFCTKHVRSSGVGRQNCCDGVTQSGCVFALTFAPSSINAWTARCLPEKAAKCSSVKPQTPPAQSSSQISSSSCCA
mmetsp:Transcript_39764/g.113562  ORF Transcript_39764/g.113562 Transcript_39764/m.113562 type:complete len:222 (+) Transcript_39764:217-882(+)